MNPSTILDIVLLSFSVLIIIKFTVEGFFSSVLDLCKGFLAIVIAYIMRISLANLFMSLFMKKAMVSLVLSSLELYSGSSQNMAGIDIETLQNNTPELFETLLTKFGLDYPEFLSDFEEYFIKGNQEVVSSLSENVGGAIAMLLSLALALFVGLIVAYVILSIIVHFILKLTKFEEINKANKWLGLILGVVIAILVMWGVTVLVQLSIGILGPVLPQYFNTNLTEGSMIVGIFRYISPAEFIKNLIYS